MKTKQTAPMPEKAAAPTANWPI